MNTEQFEYIRTVNSLNINDDGVIEGIRRAQYITDAELALNAAYREARQTGETVVAARIPLPWWESKIAQGVPLMDMEASEIMALLKADGLDDFGTYGGQL
jgi:hypothetical protein